MYTRRLGVAPRALKDTYLYGAATALSLTDSPEYNNILVPGIPNVQMVWQNIPASEILDIESGGFKNHSQTSVYRAGFIEAGADVGIVEAGTVVPIGLLETAWLIAHRNKILRDSGINLPLPVKSETETELDCLKRLIAEADNVPGEGYKYYYPAASAAYAYEPTVKAGETLHEKFKAHKWFLPVPGDLMRIGQAYTQGWLDSLKPYDLPSPSNYAMTTGQFETVGALRVQIRTGQLFQQVASGNSSKRYSSQYVFPMVQF